MNSRGTYINNIEYFKVLSVKHTPRRVEGRSFCSLTYRYSGKVTVSVADSELVSERDSVTFVPKSLPYVTEVVEDSSFIGIHFDVPDEALPSEPIVIHDVGGAIRALFESLLKRHDGLAAELMRTANLYQLLVQLLLRTESASESVPKRIEAAKEIIELRFHDPYFSISELCGELGVGTAYVRREFASAYGRSPINYLKELRIRNAKELLLSMKISISEVARLSGYSGLSYFIQDFRKTVGESPGEFRKRICSAP